LLHGRGGGRVEVTYVDPSNPYPPSLLRVVARISPDVDPLMRRL
jgi:hypothetical protein